MSDRPDAPEAEEGRRTSPVGTPVPVDVTRDQQARATWVVLLAGPVTWAVHFLVVYLVAEAGCTGEGPGLAWFDPPTPAVVTLVATVLAVAACVVAATGARRRMRRGLRDDPAASEPAARHRHHDLAAIGVLLAVVSGVAVLFVATPALVFPSC